MNSTDESVDRAYRIVQVFMDAERRKRDEISPEKRQDGINRAVADWWKTR